MSINNKPRSYRARRVLAAAAAIGAISASGIARADIPAPKPAPEKQQKQQKGKGHKIVRPVLGMPILPPGHPVHMGLPILPKDAKK